MTKDLEVCPGCGAETVVALGIGPYCPNEKCPRSDDLRPESEYQKGPAVPTIALTSNPVVTRFYAGDQPVIESARQMADEIERQAQEIERLQREANLAGGYADMAKQAANERDRLREALERLRSDCGADSWAGRICTEALRGADETAAVPESICPFYQDGIHRPEKYVNGTHCRCQARTPEETSGYRPGYHCAACTTFDECSKTGCDKAPDSAY